MSKNIVYEKLGKPKLSSTTERKGTMKTVKTKSYSAKAAAAGKDIGKPGKQFSKIATKAAKKYGSAEAGKRVAGAVLGKLRAKKK